MTNLLLVLIVSNSITNMNNGRHVIANTDTSIGIRIRTHVNTNKVTDVHANAS